MGVSRYTNEEIRKRKGRVDQVKFDAATEDQIAAWKAEDGIDDFDVGASASRSSHDRLAKVA